MALTYNRLHRAQKRKAGEFFGIVGHSKASMYTEIPKESLSLFLGPICSLSTSLDKY